MELRELRLIVSRYFPIAFVVFSLCLAVGFAAAFLPQKTYRTGATIVLDVNNDPELGGVSVQQASFLLPAIEQKAMSTSMRERAAADVPEALRNTRVDIDAASDVSVLRIRGTSTSPEASQAWVNAIADRLVEEQSSTSPVVLGVLDSAPLKRRPIAPNVEPILAAFIVLGVIAGLFSTLAADRIKRAFDTNQTVRDRLGTTVLGEIPVLRRRTERRRPVISLLDGNSRSPLANAFETVRTNVEFRMAQVQADRVAVVSLSPDSDRSMIAAGLCCSLATVGRNVVAIEADLRRPMLAEQLGIRPRTGLGDIATFGPEALVLQPTRLARLEVLPAGLPAGRAADVVTTHLPRVVDDIAKDHHRTLVVDSPPMRLAPESAIVMSTARYVVLVVNNRSSDFANLSEAIELINDAGGILLGVVVNGVPRRRLRRLDDQRMTRTMRDVDPVAGEKVTVPVQPDA